MFKGYTQDTIDFFYRLRETTIRNGWMNTGMNTGSMYSNPFGSWQLKWGP